MVTAKGISTHLQHCSSLTEGELRFQQHCSQGQLAGKFSIVGIFEHVGGKCCFPPALGGASQRRRWGGLFSEFVSGLAMCFLNVHSGSVLNLSSGTHLRSRCSLHSA